MSGSAKDPKEMFEEIKDWYDEVDEQFLVFALSPLGREHKETLGDFIHETRGLAGKVGRALLKGELPDRTRPDIKWAPYRRLRAHGGIMELILEMANDKST